MSDPVADPVPAGQVLAAEIEARDWTQADFAEVLGRPTQFVSEIVTGKKEITRESAAQIGAALGTSPEFWLNLQDAYLLREQSKNAQTQRELDNVRRRARLNQLAPVSALLKRGIIRGRTLEEQEAEIMELFSLTDLSQEPGFVLAARRSNAAEQLSAAQLAWVACIRRAARSHAAVVPFSPEKLARLAKRLPSVLTRPDQFRDLPNMFAETGVVLVYVEALPGAKIDGCAFFLDGTPVIGLSGRGKRLDKILFTMLHETAHLTLGHVNSDEIVIVDDEQRSGDSTREQEANDQAVTWIFPLPLPQSRDRINQGWVTQMALERSLAPIVVVGHLQKSERLEWRSTLARNAPTVNEELESWLQRAFPAGGLARVTGLLGDALPCSAITEYEQVRTTGASSFGAQSSSPARSDDSSSRLASRAYVSASRLSSLPVFGERSPTASAHFRYCWARATS